ncbi:unnamed protein product [Paramecium sonneborni]|uniref:Cyclic nucleotide-binding domain-containing protein n=1 Tax=Paramecium sonneborni TaxID=65129 RepID=A0A8S1MCU5_9CILI|nr:unnamed protein product [Paramecium sonneborni]
MKPNQLENLGTEQENSNQTLHGQSGRQLLDSRQKSNYQLIKKIKQNQKNKKETKKEFRASDLIAGKQQFIGNYGKNSEIKLSHYGPYYAGKPPKNKKNFDESPFLMDSQIDDDIEGFSNKAWKKYPLEILMIILRFISFITKSNFATSFRLINRNVFEIVGDKAAYFRYYLFNDYFKYEKPSPYEKMKYQLNQQVFVPLRKMKVYNFLSKNKLILRPESLTSIAWNIYILTILNMNVLYVSARVSFKFDTSNSFDDSFQQFRQILFDVLPSYSFILEILFKFNTCYYYKGTVIENRYQIAKNYFRTSFFFDVFVIIPFFLSLRFEVDYLDLVLILKVFQIKKFSGNLFDRLELSTNQIAIFDLVKLGYTILAVAHFCACLWFLVGSTGNDQISWVIANNIQNEPWHTQYLTSFYFSIVTMTTIGYGDITPLNLRERIFTICMTVAAVGIFGYSIGNINSIYAEWSRKSYEFRQNMNALKKYMRLKGLDKHLAEKIRKYFEYVWSDAEEENDREAFKFAEQIPTQLLEEMKIDINMKVVKRINFLTENFSEQFLIQLSKNLIEEKYAPEQIIYKQNDQSDYLYILQKGELQFYITLKNKQESQKYLESICGESLPFGVLEFFQKQNYQVSCKSTQFTYVLKIHRNQFVELLLQNSKDYFTFCEMKDQVTFLNKQDIVDVTCRACNKTTHVIKECPMVCGYPNRAKVLLNYRRNVPSDRKHFQRTFNRRIDTLMESHDIKNSILLFICKNKLIDDLQQDSPIRKNQTESDIESFESLKIGYHLTVSQQIESKRPLSFQGCNDALQDDELQSKIKDIVKYLKKKESFYSYQESKSCLKQEDKTQNFNFLMKGSDQSNQLFPKQLSSSSEQAYQDSNKRGSKTQLSKYKNLIDVIIEGAMLNSPIKMLVQEQNEQEDEPGKIRGQFIDLFEGFEQFKNFDNYLKHNNLGSIIKLRERKKSRRQ